MGLLINPQEVQRPNFAIGSRESFSWIILNTILCLVLDSQGINTIEHGMPEIAMEKTLNLQTIDFHKPRLDVPGS